VAQEATWHAPAQNSRRETNWLGSDIAILVRWASGLGARTARSRPRRNDAGLQIGDGAEGVRRSQTAWVDGGFCKRAEWLRVGWRSRSPTLVGGRRASDRAVNALLRLLLVLNQLERVAGVVAHEEESACDDACAKPQVPSTVTAARVVKNRVNVSSGSGTPYVRSHSAR
jgi:hypothetical protein